MWSELERAQQDLIGIKSSFHDFLIKSYANEELALNTFEYLAKAVRRIIKKESVKIDFNQGGDALWYINVFNYMSAWLEAEKRTSDLLSQELENIIEDD